jgi:hypothetical protein
MDFFDINCIAGREIIESGDGGKNIGDFYELLLKNNIKKTVLTNKLSINYDWNVGNSELSGSSDLNKNENIYFSFVLCPEVYHMFKFSDYIKDAYKNKVRLLRIFPKSHLFYLNDYYMQKIYDEISGLNFPLMLDLKELDITGNKYFAIDDLRILLSRHKRLHLILQTSLKQCMFNRFYFPLLEEFENLYLEISGMLLMDQVEHYVEKFGAGRLIYGSNYPETDFAINTARIELAEISQQDKENICFNNLNNIFNSIKL